MTFGNSNFDTKGIKTEKEIQMIKNKSVQICMDKIKTRFTIDELKYSNNNEKHIEEIEDIIQREIEFIAGLGMAHNCKNDSDDIYFYTSLIEHLGVCFTDTKEIFKEKHSFDTKVAQMGITKLYSEVKSEVFSQLRKEIN